jgi:hypothetical protein
LFTNNNNYYNIKVSGNKNLFNNNIHPIIDLSCYNKNISSDLCMRHMDPNITFNSNITFNPNITQIYWQNNPGQIMIYDNYGFFNISYDSNIRYDSPPQSWGSKDSNIIYDNIPTSKQFYQKSYRITHSDKRIFFEFVIKSKTNYYIKYNNYYLLNITLLDDYIYFDLLNYNIPNDNITNDDIILIQNIVLYNIIANQFI